MENPEIRRHKIKKYKKKEKIDREKVTSPNERSSPPKKKKVKKTATCEDIIDGFAIRSFKSYEDLLKIIDLEKERAALLQGSQNFAEGSETRISGGSGNDTVSSNESHSKTSGKLKVPKWKKTLSTTDQENNASIMRLDLSRCSAHSEDQAVEDVSSSSGSSTPDAAGIARQAHSHSLCQQQQFSSSLEPSSNALQPHPEYPNKTSIGSKEVRKHKSEDRKDPFSISKQECPGNADVPTDGNPVPSSQPSKVLDKGLQIAESNQRPNGIIDCNSNPPSTSFGAVNNTLAGASSSTKVQNLCQDVSFLNNYRNKNNTQTHKSVTASSTSTSVDNALSTVEIQPDAEVPQTGAKFVSNGSISSSKCQFEDKGPNHGFYPSPSNPELGSSSGSNVPPLVSQSSHTSSQPAFSQVLVKKQSPKSTVCNSGTQASEPPQQIVAPISNPKIAQGRVGSQTLFTPYATTAITRVNSPLSSGDSPSASRACSGFQSSTVIQQENSIESLNPKGSTPLSRHSHQPYPPQRPSHQPHQKQHSTSKITHQHNQSINNNHLKSSSHSSFGHSPINDFNSKSDSKLSVDCNSHSLNKPILNAHKQRHSENHSNHSSAEHVGRTPIENKTKKENNSSEITKHLLSGNRPQSALPNNHLYNHNHLQQSQHLSQEKGLASSTSTRPKATAAFGSITKLLDFPTNTSSSHSSPSPSGIKSLFPNHPQSQIANHQQHHHHPEHYQLHSSTNLHSFEIGDGSHPSKRREYSPHYIKNVETQGTAQISKTTNEVPTNTGGGHLVSTNNNISHRNPSSNNQTFSVAGTHSSTTSTHSPREHSPARERDSYSSNVSSLSRSSASVTPVSTFQQSSHYQQLSPNLSPHLQSSYSKAASWLSTVPSFSPISRPTPPPPTSVSAYSTATSASLPSQPSSVPSPYRSYPGIDLPSSHPGTTNMFAPPLLPLSSIPVNPASQPPTYGPSTDSLFPVPTSSDILRREFESRLTAAERGPSTFLSRPSDLHPHHSLLPSFSGVGHLSPHTPGAPPNPHSPMFSAPLFKDLSKVGIESPFYRSNMVLSYPGINGMLPPPGLATPFAPPPSQLPSYTQKKTGKWNAMHVRIAWEIYQQQQKAAGGDRNPSKASPIPSNSLKPISSSLSTSTSQTLQNIGRPADVTTHFTGQMMSQSPSARGMPFDPLLLNPASSHLGSSIPRYGFGALGPSFGGLSGLGSGLMSRDLSTLVSLSPGQDQWARFPSRPSFLDPANALGTNSQLNRPSDQRDSKTPTETRRQKEADSERLNRQSASSSRESHARATSPFRDRSPIRTGMKTPIESGEHDSRSSRSSEDSHNSSIVAVHSSHIKSSSSLRNNEDSASNNGECEKALTPLLSNYDRQRIGVDKSIHAPGLPSRMCPTTSPLTTPPTSAWDTFPGLLGSGQPVGLNILQLSERERELSPRVPPPPSLSSLRPNLFGTNPYGGLPLGALGVSQLSVSHSHSQGHLHSSQLHNGPSSPGASASSKAQSQSEQVAATAHSSRLKEDSHQLR